jgi:lysozyme family protein
MSNQLLQAINNGYQQAFDTMQFDESKLKQSKLDAALILSRKHIYETICNRVNGKMPWYFVGILHFRESTCNMMRHLHNGDSLKTRTVNVPAGRPIEDPMNGKAAGYTYIESAVDALTMEEIAFDKEESWTLQLMLLRFEKWNGFGYRRLQHSNPYLWNGSNHYTGGKFDRDGHYDPSLNDQQTGAAVLLRLLTDKTLGIVN